MVKGMFKRLLVGLLAFCLVIPSITGVLSVKAAGAMDRVKTYIALGAGKNTVSQSDLSSLNKEELQFLGVYMSNYFVPFRTNIGLKSDDETITLKKDITENLKQVLGFTDALANQFGEYLFSMVRGSSKTLDVTFQAENPTRTGKVDTSTSPSFKKVVADDGGNISITSERTEGKQKATYASLLSAVFSTREQYDNIFGDDGWSGGKLSEGVAKYRYAVFYVQGTESPVFVADLLGEEVTASEFVFLKGLQSVGVENGYGMSLFDLGVNEIEEPSQSVFEQLLEKTGGNNVRGYSIFGSELRVDAFGNLMYLGANNQYIIMNGASNPFTWRPVAPDTGKDYDSVKAGRFVNLTNLMSLDLYARKDLFKSSYPSSDKGEVTDSAVTEKTTHNLKGLDFSKSKLSVDYNILTSNEMGIELPVTVKFNEDGIADVNELNKLAHIILKNPKAVEYAQLANDSKNKYFYAMDGSSGSITFKGTQKEAESLVVEIAKFYDAANSSIFVGDSKEVVDIFRQVAEKVKESNEHSRQLEQGGQTSTQGQNAKWGTGEISFSTLQEKLKPNNLSGSDYLLQVARGFKKTAGDDPFFGESKQSQFISKVVKDGNGRVAQEDFYAFNMITPKDSWGSKPKTYVLGGARALSNDGNGKTINFYDSYALIDNYGAFGWGGDKAKDVDYKAINFGTILDGYDVNKDMNEKSNSFIGDIVKNMKEQNAFSNNLSKIEKGGMVTVDKAIFSKMAVSLYITYAYASLYNESDEGKAETLGKVGFRLNKEGLPQPEKGIMTLDQEAVEDMQIASIKNWVYYLLHPLEGFKYTFTLLKNTINSFLVGIHEDITGSRGTGIVAGTTKYKSSFGLVSLPEVSETEWMANAVKFYNKTMIYLVLMAFVFAVVYWAIGVIEIKKALSGFAIATAVIVLIPSVLTTSITWSNNVISAPYSQRFNHWALIQHQTYSSALDEAASGENASYVGYLRKLNQENLGINQGGDPVNIKWQAPKKMASLMLDSELLSQDTSIGKMLSGAINKAYSGEGYLKDKDSVYMFRSYLDLSSVSRYLYGSVKDGIAKVNMNPKTTLWGEDLQQAYSNMEQNLQKARVEGYLNSSEGELQYRIKAMLGATPYNNALQQKGTIKDLSLDDLVGISPKAFNFSVPMYTKGLNKEDQAMKDYVNSWSEHVNYNIDEIASLGMYGVFSESPYYYFSFSLYDQGLNFRPGSSGGYKDLLLKSQNAGYFYNNTAKGNGLGEMKDYLDMRGLFTYVIPYLRQGNSIVREWDSVYGIKLYEGVSTDEEELKSEKIKLPENAELRQKTWHNVNVARLYSIYTPWVDLMYDSKYAKPTTVTVLGQRVEIQDPLNPASYPADRPMVFSRSEQLNLGYKESDLTDVERKIISLQDKGMTRMYELLDYYGFNDNVVNSAVAMELTFLFNREFSDQGLFNQSGTILYPQNYEMTDFSNDAYLRLILANSTGDSLYQVSDEGFYKGIVDKSNTFVALMLIVSDVAGQYVLPVMKVLTIIGLLILSFLIALTIVLKIKDKPGKYALENWVVPLFKFLSATVVFSYALALLMPVGTGNIAKNSFSIKLGDPTVAMGILLILIGIMCWVYFKILKEILSSVKETSFGIGSLLVATGVGIVASGKSALGGASSSVSGLIQDKKQEDRTHKRNTDLAKQIAEAQARIKDKDNADKNSRKIKNAKENKKVSTPKDNNSSKAKVERKISEGSAKLRKTSSKSASKHKSFTGNTISGKKPPKK